MDQNSFSLQILRRLLIFIIVMMLSIFVLFFSYAVIVGSFRQLTEQPYNLPLGLLMLCAWLSFIVMSVGWVVDRRVSKWIVKAGVGCGLCVCAYVLFTPISATLIFAIPAVLFGTHLVFFHGKIENKAEWIENKLNVLKERKYMIATTILLFVLTASLLLVTL
mgnify:CR=1 FL=1